ncbi:sulfate permease [Dietzia alimentaria]|uniref:sulfate permease n=1 Tax=Dietzia alimentaria TaxID=665550 RepID=UPI001930E2F9|nr:sulfate permease [Dietzia alimentaria]
MREANVVIRLLWAASVRTSYSLRRCMPTNRLLDAIRTRRGLKWGLPAMLLAGPHLLAASICTNLIADGGPGWLNIFVILFIWNAMKFLIMGPVSIILLVRVRVQEARQRRRARRAQAAATEPQLAENEPVSENDKSIWPRCAVLIWPHPRDG